MLCENYSPIMGLKGNQLNYMITVLFYILSSLTQQKHTLNSGAFPAMFDSTSTTLS